MDEVVANETAVVASNSWQETPRKPIIIKLKKKKKKKKRRYSRGLKDVQVRARRLSKARLKLRKAAVKGSLAFRKRSKKSAKKKRDGAIKDLLPNAGWAMSRTMRSASDVPYQVSKALNTRGLRRRRRGLRLTGGRRSRRLRLLALRTVRRRRRRRRGSRRLPSRRLRLMAIRTVRRRRRRGARRMPLRRPARVMAQRRMRMRRRRRRVLRRMPLRPFAFR